MRDQEQRPGSRRRAMTRGRDDELGCGAEWAPIVPRMAGEADAVRAAVEGIVAAFHRGDWESVWQSYSPAAQAACRADAAARGGMGLHGGEVLEHLANLDGHLPVGAPGDVEIKEVRVDGGRATATLQWREETTTVAFVNQGGAWKLAIADVREAARRRRRYFDPVPKDPSPVTRMAWVRRHGLKVTLPCLLVLAVLAIVVNALWFDVVVGVWGVVWVGSLVLLSRDIQQARRTDRDDGPPGHADDNQR